MKVSLIHWAEASDEGWLGKVLIPINKDWRDIHFWWLERGGYAVPAGTWNAMGIDFPELHSGLIYGIPPGLE